MAFNSRAAEKKERISVYLVPYLYNLIRSDYESTGISPSGIVSVAVLEYYERRKRALEAVKGAEHEACP